MKKALILAAVAAIALSACSKNEIIETINKVPEEAPIGFSNYAPKSLTKADGSYVSGTTLVSNKTFAVYAWQTAYNSFLAVNPGAPDFMNPAIVTWKGGTTDGKENTYTPLRYWPSGDEPQNLSFTAYYPAGDGTGITAPTWASGVGTYAFEAKNTPAAMVDFCVADVVNDQVYGSTNAGSYKGTVHFTFKHQLTKVQFKFKKADDVDAATTIKLVDAKLKNVKTKGTLSATYALASPQGVNKLGTTTTAWSDQALAATPVVYDVTLNGSNPEVGSKIDLTTTASTVADGDIFLMVPQTMVEKAVANPQYLEITWEVITGGVTTTNTKKLYLDECVTTDGGDVQANIDWNKNNFVTYTITIGPKPIYFTAEVTGWDTEQNGYYNVN